MTYSDKYPNCINCPVDKYCGTMISCTRLCHSLDDNIASKKATHVLALSKDTKDK